MNWSGCPIVSIGESSFYCHSALCGDSPSVLGVFIFLMFMAVSFIFNEGILISQQRETDFLFLGLYVQSTAPMKGGCKVRVNFV